MLESAYSFMTALGIKSNQDKWLHGLVGLFVGYVSMWLFGAVSIVIVATVAFGKEGYDQYKYGGFDLFDAMATIIGGWLGIALMGLIGG